MLANISRTKSFSKILQVTNESITNEGSQTNLTTCDLFPVAIIYCLYVSYSSNVGATYKHLKFKTNLCSSILPEKEKKELKIEQSFM